MRIFAGDVSLPVFRWLIDHAGWQQLPVAPGEDHQGLDVRHRIGKNGVVFSAYRIPRGPGSGMFGRVGLEPLPQWADSAGLNCEISVEKVCRELGLDDDGAESFRSLDRRLDDVRCFLESDTFARTRLRRAIAGLSDGFEAHRSTLRSFLPEIGFMRMMSGVVSSYFMQRSFRARYRRVLKSLDSRSRSQPH